ncbi:MAG: PilZ domain-containing protein [Pseudomonadota bacterium]
MHAHLQPLDIKTVDQEKDDDIAHDGPERRRHQRVPLQLGGRFLHEGDDYPLVSLNVSCAGGLFRARSAPPQETKIVCYLDELGRIAGDVIRSNGQTFAVVFEATDRKRDKLADQLMWILNKGRYGLEETRAAKRYAGGKQAKVVRPNGAALACRVLDLSVTGAAFECSGPLPFIGERVQAGRLFGIVVRAEAGEFAIRIVKPDESPADISVT